MSKQSVLFTKVAVKTPSRSKFDLSHDHKTTMKWGTIVPIMTLECLPGDSINVRHQALVRLAPQLAPLMHRVDVKLNTFFVPNRLLWKNWENFITSSPDSTTNELPAHPYWVLSSTPGLDTFMLNSLAEYLGVHTPSPVDGGRHLSVSLLPFAAYQRICFDWFRDQNLSGIANDQWESNYGLEDGSNTGVKLDNLLTLQNRSFEHDYFTSCLPWAQKGVQVEIPLGSVELKDDWYDGGSILEKYPKWDVHLEPGESLDSDTLDSRTRGTQALTTNPTSDFSTAGLGVGAQMTQVPGTPDDPWRVSAYDPAGSLYVQAITINELRRAEALQTYLELLARGGSRYVEYIKNFFDTDPQDYRLDRAEYIGGSVTPVTMSEVLNTAGIDGEYPQGNMSGHAVASVNTGGDWYNCKEHGFIITVASIVPRTSYTTGTHRMFFRFDPLDYFVPQFEGLGEQEVYNDELVTMGSDESSGFGGIGKQPFGYMPRHIDYKFIPSRTSSYMRPSVNSVDVQQNLSFWNLSRYWSTVPSLGRDFIDSSTTRTDIFAVQDDDFPQFYCHFGNLVQAVRRMKKFNIPTL